MISLHIGDCRDVLRSLPDESVDCIITSPPYWGLRDYGVDGQIGLEETLDEHLLVVVAVFEECRRVLKNEGTCWINYGDCYATKPAGNADIPHGKRFHAKRDDRSFVQKPFSTIGGQFKAKDLLMIPNRLAIALQDAGWWVRSEIIWAKPNPMPESVTDRPASAHEKIFLLTKSARYFYDAEAVREPLAASSVERLSQDLEGQAGSTRANGNTRPDRPMKAVRGRSTYGRHTLGDSLPEGAARGKGDANGFRGGSYVGGAPGKRRESGNKPSERSTRNCRNVWTIATRPFSDAHFATFPPEIAERGIKAGCPEGGVVLDPFGGAGTTGLAADRLQRDAILIELNEDYAAIALKRLRGDAGMLSDITVVKTHPHTETPIKRASNSSNQYKDESEETA